MSRGDREVDPRFFKKAKRAEDGLVYTQDGSFGEFEFALAVAIQQRPQSIIENTVKMIDGLGLREEVVRALSR